MYMKDRVLATLKPLVAPKGFKQDELESIAALIANNLKDDSTDEEVKAGVDSFLPYAELMQKSGLYSRMYEEYTRSVDWKVNA